MHGRRRVAAVMIEYILIKDVNDRPEHAHELGRLLAPRRGHLLLNLIPYNPTEVMEAYEAPPREHVDAFYAVCVSEPHFLLTRIRREMGQVRNTLPSHHHRVAQLTAPSPLQDIAGACGQLALVHAKKTDAAQDIEDFPGAARGSKSKAGASRGPPGGSDERDESWSMRSTSSGAGGISSLRFVYGGVAALLVVSAVAAFAIRYNRKNV